jgi:hypothetical protein
MSTLIDLSFLYLSVDDDNGSNPGGVTVTYNGTDFNAQNFVNGVYQITQEVVFNAVNNNVILPMHGFESGDKISFATINNTTGLTVNVLYDVVLIPSDDGGLITYDLGEFKLSLNNTLVDFTTNGTGTVKIRSNSGFFNLASGLFDQNAFGLDLIQIPFSQVDMQVTHDSGIPYISSIPKNVGRYDYTIVTTLKGDPTCKGWFTTEYHKPVPTNIPPWYGQSYRSQVESLKDPSKYLTILPLPFEIVVLEDERVYDGNPKGPEFETIPKLIESPDPNNPINIPVRVKYFGEKLVAPLSAPIEIGVYTIEYECTDFNYVGSATSTYTIRNLTNIEAETAAAEYQEKVDIFNEATSDTGNGNIYEGALGGISSSSSLSNSSYASSSNAMTKKEFVETGILTILDKADIQGLGTIKTLAECAQSLPQRLMIFAAAKIAAFVLSYIPGLGIIKLLTSIMELIEMVKKIMALIEFVKENPWAALNMVLETSGAYDALGKLANEQIAAIQESFPGMTGDVGQFVKDVANGLVDICNLDISGNPIATLIKADNTKTPTAVTKFIPATSRQPSEAKAKYDFFQFQLRDALNKDTDKLKKMSDEGNTVGVQEYVSMLTAVHELAYNYHDRIAETGTPVGLLNGSTSDALSSVYNVLGEATSILSSVYPDSTSTTATTSGTTKTSGFSVDSLNAGLGSIANTIDGVTAGLSSITSFAMGETGFSITALRNEFNFGAKEMLKKNPFWSKETIKEYNDRVNRIKSEMENNVDAIRNNPANAKAAAAGSATTSSSGSSTGGISSLISSASSSLSSLIRS